jgi:hypothetical protein
VLKVSIPSVTHGMPNDIRTMSPSDDVVGHREYWQAAQQQEAAIHHPRGKAADRMPVPVQSLFFAILFICAVLICGDAPPTAVCTAVPPGATPKAIRGCFIGRGCSR